MFLTSFILTDAAKVFGIEHIIYLILAFTIGITSVILIKKFIRKEEHIVLTMRIIGFILLGLIIWNRICICERDSNWLLLIPDSYCGLTSFVISLALISGKKDNFIFQFFPYVGLIGGIGVMLYPSFVYQDPSFFYHATISGLLHHTVSFFAIILIFITKRYTPTLKKWYIPLISYALILALGYFEIYVLKFDDAFNLIVPIVEGTILTWYVVSILVFIVSYTVMLLFDLYHKKHPENKNVD